MDSVGPIFTEVVKIVGGSIVKYIKYQIKFNHYLEQFNASKGRLCSRKDDIGSRLYKELRYGKVAKDEVRLWLEEAGEFIARPNVVDEANGWGYLQCCCRAKILEERDQELKELYDRGGSFVNQCLVKDIDPSPLVVKLPTTKLQGHGDVIAEILTSLMGDEVTKLGVWGMGGVGKTTIMEHVHNKLSEERKFKIVIWATVSQDFDIYKLHEQIATILKEKDILEQPNTKVRAGMIFEVLERHKPYLLILDDVWRSFKLEDVGIPEPLVSDGCKVVLTTRSKRVAREMDCQIIKVNTLSQKEALKLFLDKVGNIVLSDQGCIKGTLESTLKGIVNECDGLPLAIVTVAGSLKGISEPRLWSAALNQLKDCKRNVAGTDDDDDDVFGILKFSYDRLENSKIQHCFLCCALYPEDYKIRINSIIDYWIDEGLIDEMETLQAMRDEGLDLLTKLIDNSLLESKEVSFGEHFGEDCVRMHDLVRDMAVRITRVSPRFMIEAGKGLTKLPEKGKWTDELEKISLMRNEIREIPSSILCSKCTMLTTLLLSNNCLSTIPEFVFEHMPALKILDLSSNYELRSLPSSLSRLVNLTTLLLQETSLTEVPSLSELGALKKLDLGMTRIKEVPEGLEMCRNLKYLSLQWVILDDTILSNLSKLQQLFVGESVPLKGKVIGSLKKLEVFYGRFQTMHDWSIFLNCFHGQEDRLSRYRLTVGNLDFNDPDCYTIALPFRIPGKVIKFRRIDIVGEHIILPQSVNILKIEYCHNLRSLNGIKGATDLSVCEIRNCKGMECVFSSWINPLVQTLERLTLCGLDKLEGLFEAEAIAMSPPPPPGTFSSLKSLRVLFCDKIKKLIPCWKLLGYLQSLEVIYVSTCKEMEEIIASDHLEEEGEEGGDIINLILPKLKDLRLAELPALKSICSRRAVMVCDSLQEIFVGECKGLRRIPVYLDNAQPSPPPSLKQITAVPEEWWESLEWDHPNAKDALRPLVCFDIYTRLHHH